MTHPLLGTVAPVIPEFGALVGLFFAICGVLLARGAIATWTHSFGYLLEWLAKQLKFTVHSWVGSFSLDLGGPFRAADGWVLTALQDWLRGAEIEMTYFLHASTVLLDWMGAELEKLAKDSLHWASWSQHVFVPAFVRALMYPFVKLAQAAKTVAVDAYDLGLRGERRWRDLEHSLAGRARGWVKKWVPVVFPGILAIPGLIREWRGVSHWLARHQRRISRLEALLGAAGFAAAMANALGLPNWRCVTRGNLGRVSRRLCGLPARALEDILGLLVDLFLLTNICQAITLIEDGFSFVEPEITAFINAVETMACYGNDEHLPPGPPVFLSLPPVTGLVLPA